MDAQGQRANVHAAQVGEVSFESDILASEGQHSDTMTSN